MEPQAVSECKPFQRGNYATLMETGQRLQQHTDDIIINPLFRGQNSNTLFLSYIYT